MKWKNINELPSELVGADLLLRIEFRKPLCRRKVTYISGDVDEEGDVYTDEQSLTGIGGFLSRDLYNDVWFVDPKEIPL